MVRAKDYFSNFALKVAGILCVFQDTQRFVTGEKIRCSPNDPFYKSAQIKNLSQNKAGTGKILLRCHPAWRCAPTQCVPTYADLVDGGSAPAHILGSPLSDCPRKSIGLMLFCCARTTGSSLKEKEISLLTLPQRFR